MATNHCNCCIPQCPTPNLEIEGKSATSSWGSSNWSSTRVWAFFQSEKRSDTSSSSDYVVPIPERCRPYRDKKITYGGTSAFVDKNDDDEVTREYAAGGSAFVLWSKNQPSPSCDRDATATGESTYSKSDTYYASVIDADTQEETRYVHSKITETLRYGGVDSRIINPAYDPDDDDSNAPFYLYGDHGYFIVSRKVTTKTPTYNLDENDNPDGWDGGFETETESSTFFTGVGHALPAPDFGVSHSYVNTPTVYTKNYSYDAGSSYHSEEWLEPWTEAALIKATKDCADSKEWIATTNPIAIEEVIYAEVPVLDKNGDTVYYDDDKDNETPDVVKLKETEECFTSITVKKGRYRAVVPWSFNPPPEPDEQRWHGTYHKMMVKETFTLEDHDPEDSGSPQPTVTEKELEWRGEGEMPYLYSELQGDDDWDELSDEDKELKLKEQDRRLDTWKTEWIEIDFPPEKGEIEVNLIRSQCYTGGRWSYH